MNTKTFAQIVEDMGSRKTYKINENLSVYVTRKGKRTKVFHVQYSTLNYPTPREYNEARREAHMKHRRNVWPTAEHSVTFDFTEEGYKEALAYVNRVAHFNQEVEAWYKMWDN